MSMACFVPLLYRCTLSNLTNRTDWCINVLGFVLVIFFAHFTILILQQEHLGPSEMGLWNIYRSLKKNNGFAQGEVLLLSGKRSKAVRVSLLGELWDYSTVLCWTLSWAGRLMWVRTSNASQNLTKVKHFSCLSLPDSSSRREICSGKSDMKCQEQNDCFGKGDPN